MLSSTLKKIILVGSTIMLPSIVFANFSSTQSNETNFTPRIEASPSSFHSGNWLLTIGSGAAFISNSQNTWINNATGFTGPSGQDTYTTNNGSSTSALLILAGGYQWKLLSDWFPRMLLELKYTHFSGATLGGQVLKLSLPNANNFIYNYDLQTQSGLINLKTDLVSWHNLMPYFSLGMGMASNQMTNYTEYNQPTIAPRTSPGFSNKTTTNFTYQIGLGLDYLIKNKLVLSAGYAYQDLGDVNTGSGLGSTYTGQSLAQTAKAQLVEVTMTYLFKN
jgi:opacity protein-like surface antigen